MLAANVGAVELFQRCSTQWRYRTVYTPAGMTAIGLELPRGLDYRALEQVARIYGQELGEDLFARIQILEREYIQASNDGYQRNIAHRAKR